MSDETSKSDILLLKNEKLVEESFDHAKQQIEQEQEQEVEHHQNEVELGFEEDNEEDLNHEFDDNNNNNNGKSQINHSNNLVIKSDMKEETEEDNILVASCTDDTGLYDDVMTEQPTSPNLLNETSGSTSTTTNTTTPNNINNITNFSNKSLIIEQDKFSINKQYTKRVSCYVGNLTWWTTDKDLSDLIQQLGVNDLLEIKFYENKVNGQSKGFAMCTVGSDSSFRIIMEKLPKKQLNGLEPIVTNYSRHNFNQFEEQARKDMPSNSGNGSAAATPNAASNPNHDSYYHHHHNNYNSTTATPLNTNMQINNQPNSSQTNMQSNYLAYLFAFV